MGINWKSAAAKIQSLPPENAGQLQATRVGHLLLLENGDFSWSVIHYF